MWIPTDSLYKQDMPEFFSSPRNAGNETNHKNHGGSGSGTHLRGYILLSEAWESEVRDCCCGHPEGTIILWLHVIHSGMSVLFIIEQVTPEYYTCT